MNAPPLIGHVVYRFAVGGLENGAVNLINRLQAKRQLSFERMVEDHDRDRRYAGLLRTRRSVHSGTAIAAPLPRVRS